MRAIVIGPFGQDAHFVFSALETRPKSSLYGISQSESGEKLEIFRKLHPTVPVQIRDFTKKSECNATLDAINPHLIFHLAAVHRSVNFMQSVDYEQKVKMWNCHYAITENLVNWISHNRESRLVFAGSSQMFAGHMPGTRIDEKSEPIPLNEYGKSKLAGWKIIQEARRTLDLHLSCGILFNHTSEFSKPEFLFPNIAKQVLEIFQGKKNEINVRNKSAFIDVSYAGEIAKGLIAMAESNKPGDYVLGSGNSIVISKIIERTLINLGLGANKISIRSQEDLSEQLCLVSDSSKARENLGWATVLRPDEILTQMVQKIINEL